MTSHFTFSGDKTEGRTVTLSDVGQPHNDSLTIFRVKLTATDLDAECWVESLDGADGFEPDSVEFSGVVKQYEMISLGLWLRQLGDGPLWDENRTWKSFSGELVIGVSVDSLGHVSAHFTISPSPWSPSWSASCTLAYTLGEISQTGRDLQAWFRTQVSTDRSM